MESNGDDHTSLPTESDQHTGRIVAGTDPIRAMRWFVLHTKSRQEKAVGSHLDAKGISYFLPLMPHIRDYGRRKFTVHLPMFPGYVFLHGSLEHAYEADRSKRLANIIHVADQDQIEWELRNLRMAVEAEAALDPYPYLNLGVRVEVRSGPFSGLQGVIENRVRTDRLLLQVDILGRAVSVEINGSLLDPI